MDIEVSATQDRLAIEAVLFHGQGGTGWVIRVSHLSRRRYYDGFVAGENERGFFLFERAQPNALIVGR